MFEAITQWQIRPELFNHVKGKKYVVKCELIPFLVIPSQSKNEMIV